MNTYRVYYTDGNKRLFSADSMTDVMRYLLDTDTTAETIYKIELV